MIGYWSRVQEKRGEDWHNLENTDRAVTWESRAIPIYSKSYFVLIDRVWNWSRGDFELLR